MLLHIIILNINKLSTNFLSSFMFHLKKKNLNDVSDWEKRGFKFLFIAGIRFFSSGGAHSDSHLAKIPGDKTGT